MLFAYVQYISLDTSICDTFGNIERSAKVKLSPAIQGFSLTKESKIVIDSLIRYLTSCGIDVTFSL